jgi:hypothetical protein
MNFWLMRQGDGWRKEFSRPTPDVSERHPLMQCSQRSVCIASFDNNNSAEAFMAHNRGFTPPV